MLRSSDVKNMTKKEIEDKLKEIEERESATKKPKKKMKTSKKALYTAFLIAIILIIFTMAMIFMDKDNGSLEILATAGVGCLPIMYGIYSHNNTKINLKHMEEDYDPNYNENNGIY